MAIDIKSYNQILGEMARKIIADSPLNDLNVGSVLLTLLEAAAQVDFENNASALSILELLSIDNTRNSDLDNRAADYGLSRTPSRRATGLITVKDSSITKRSTNLYQIKNPPISGSTVIYVNNAAGWSATGNIFIGRGTSNFEGPIPYTSIVNNGTFYTINLGVSLQKDHLISDIIVDAQGTTDRLIRAGIGVSIPANNQSPQVDYTVLRQAVIPAGEDTVENVAIIAVLPGSSSNAGINTITLFSSPPFSSATVFNSAPLTDGIDIESDDSLRERIKSYANTLARGTSAAILTAIIGISSSEDNKQVASAVIEEPPSIGDPSIVYIDDGSGFQPSFVGQSVDKLINSANGKEEFLQLSNFPLPRPQVVNTIDGPYELKDGMQLRVLVDGIEEAIEFKTEDFVNITLARLSEVIIAINSKSTTFKATFTSDSSRLLLFTTNHSAETIQVASIKSSDDQTLFANLILKFPTNLNSYIKLYQNNKLLSEQAKPAILQSALFSTWNISITGDIALSVDGTPAQNQSFTTFDFGGMPFNSLTLTDWVAAFNSKFAGITAIETSSGRMQLSSNKIGADSKLDILSGTYFDKIFGGESTTATGNDSDFQLNRQTGNLRITQKISIGDTISAGIEDTKGSIISTKTPTGRYDISIDGNGRKADVVVVPDSSIAELRLNASAPVGSTINIAQMGTTTRLTSSVLTAFANVQPGDFIYIVERSTSGYIDPSNCGIYKISIKGNHLLAGVDSYIEFDNIGGVSQSSVNVLSSDDIQFFRSSSYPQIWHGSNVTTPASASITDILNDIKNNTVNVAPSLYKTSSVKVSSTTETDGSIFMPVSIGKATSMFETQQPKETGNPPHIANKVSDSDTAATFFKRTEPTKSDAEGVSGKLVWLDRVQYSDIKGELTDDSVPGVFGVDTYSEELQSTDFLTQSNVSFDDVLTSTKGSNKGQYRSIRDKISGDKVGTQHELPRTLIDHIIGDAFCLMRPVGISSEDSIVIIMDQDSVNKTIDIPMSRRGNVNAQFAATNLAFSADDLDNEVGINFGNLQVWGKSSTNTEFANYALWMKARNWYTSGGAGSSGGSMILRSKEFGPHGNNIRFSIEHPASPNLDSSISHVNTPDFTKVTYTFGSDNVKSINILPGDTFSVSALTGSKYRLTFGLTTNLNSVSINDVISILTTSGVTSANCGQFNILAVNPINRTIDIYNPNASATGVGSNQTTNITTIADVIGTQTVSLLTNITGNSGNALDGKWFKLRDSAGFVAVYYNSGTPAGTPLSMGVNRIISINLAGGESSSTVAGITSGVVGSDSQFTSSYLGTDVTIINKDIGALPIAVDGVTPTSFTFGGSVGAANNSLNGKYFKIWGANGSVAFWYDVTGITPEPLHGAVRAVRISSVNSGDSANTVATKTAVVVNNDADFNATASTNSVTVTDASVGARTAPSTGTSGFTVTYTAGTNAGDEVIVNTQSVNVFSLVGTSVTDIVSKINTGSIIDAVATSTTNGIYKSTKEESYTPGLGYSASLGYGHDPLPINGLNGYISFYDGINWIKDFNNTNPNFILKTPMLLHGVSPSYSITTAPNYNSSVVGEIFKLVPVTLNNVKHHFTHKALSQLPIVADISISNNIRRIQIKSKLLGSNGSIEVVGGNANESSLSVIGDGRVSPGVSKNFLEIKTSAYPITLTKGDIVEISNNKTAKRLSRLSTYDSISVAVDLSGNARYLYNPKDIQVSALTDFTITDVSALYSRSAGIIWRWTHGGAGTLNLARASVGDVLNVFGVDSSWSEGNKSGGVGDGQVSGFPIINIYTDITSDYFDVVNPNGEAASNVVVGSGALTISPTPILKWYLKHSSKTQIQSITVSTGVATALTASPHKLKVGDSFVIDDTLVVPTSATVTAVTGSRFFSFTTAHADGTITGGNVIKSGRVSTKYIIESLGFNDLYRLRYVSGDEPKFVDCGVAVDDIMLLQGSTFQNINQGQFRVLGVDNNSVLFKNSRGVEELNTIVPFNNTATPVIWTANSNQVLGVVDSFKNVSIGDWIKKSEDSDSMYVQVANISGGGTILTLGSTYKGISSSSRGVRFDQLNDVNGGTILQDMDDIIFYEGDSVQVNDSVFIDNTINNNWFNTANSGTFIIQSFGSDSVTYKPYIKVSNPIAVSQTNRLIGINLQGFFIIEGEKAKYSSIRVIEHTAIDSFNPDRRTIYLTPSVKIDKISESYSSHVVSINKLNYSNDIIKGIDGYYYYTGLMRKVQRTIDGFEPDQTNYPGRRAVGGLIETMASLIHRVTLSINVTTKDGVNLNEISNDIKSKIITYIRSLGVGENVILSEIIARVMKISGVLAVTFTTPDPSTESIAVSNNEKAYCEPQDISIS